MSNIKLPKFATLVKLGSIGLLLHCPFVVADPVVHGDTPVDVCDSLRLADRCKPAAGSVEDNGRQVTIEAKRVEVTRTIDLPPQQMQGRSDVCDARFSVSYFQADSQIKVDTQVQNETCGASHGDYALRIRTTNQSGESVTRSFSETWSRIDNVDVQAKKHYPMEGGKKLLWVRVHSNRKTGCTCD